MTDTEAPPVPRRSAIVNFPTDTDISDEYADAEVLTAQGVDDDALARLGVLTHLVGLTVNGDFTDEGLEQLAGLVNLENLSLSSPRFSARGLRALQGATGLHSLTVEQADFTPKSARQCGRWFPELTHLKLTGKALGVDHLAMLRGLSHLERLEFRAGGDFLGGGDGQLDRASATELVAASPALESVDASWSNGKSLFAASTVVAMLAARPGLTVNGTWYDRKVWDDQGSTDGETAGDPAQWAPGTMIVLTEDNYESFIESTPVALVNFWTSSEQGCQAALLNSRALAGNVDQLPGVLAGRAAVAQVDQHTTGELTQTMRERYGTGHWSLAVFRRGEFVGRLGAFQPTSILGLLAPVLDS